MAASQARHSALSVHEFLELADAGPVVDVRSPCEFSAGHVPCSVNLPLFTDEQRAAVGTSYKQKGRQHAVLLGLELVGPRLGTLAREALTLAAASPGKPLRLTCARGGMRSASVAWLLGTVDVPCVTLDGGYKAYRAWCAQQFAGTAGGASPRLLLLSGLTGSGKTAALASLRAAGEAVVDLEALAGHRGSSFGSVAVGEAQAERADAQGLLPQPRPEQFENDLAAALAAGAAAAQRGAPGGRLWLEDEAQNVGRCFIPTALYGRMRSAPLLLMALPKEERVTILQADYAAAAAEALCAAAERLRSRLGGARCSEVQELIRSGDTASACRLLLDYYDAAYAHTFGVKLKCALRLTFKPGCTPAQWAAALVAAASVMDDELYAACTAVGVAEAESRARKAAARQARAAERRVRGPWTAQPPAPRLRPVAAQPKELLLGREDVLPQPLLARRADAFEAAARRAREAIAACPQVADTLDRDVELVLDAAVESRNAASPLSGAGAAE